MKDSDSSAPEQARVLLVQRAGERHKKLRYRADGVANWACVVGLIAAVVLLGYGLGGDIDDVGERLVYAAH